MLVLVRKAGQEIVIGNGIIVRVARVSGGRTFLAIEAPPDVRVDRKEVWLARNRGGGRRVVVKPTRRGRGRQR
jgi:carbon storage regulator CsrA